MNFVLKALDIHSISRNKGSAFQKTRCALFGKEGVLIVNRVRKRCKKHLFIQILYQNRPNEQDLVPNNLAIKEKRLPLRRAKFIP